MPSRRAPHPDDGVNDTLRYLTRGMQELRYTDALVAHGFQLASSRGLDYTRSLELVIILLARDREERIRAEVQSLQYPPQQQHIPITSRPSDFPSYVEPRCVEPSWFPDET